ncbi:4Fe-4S dicluster domain-containing protein [Neobacillus niacini]|uniref:4Fe-4S dicluster domain-containing protein n=1 Tax=Neobacillus niacini TaxID=86668 RepID=UPI0039830CC6
MSVLIKWLESLHEEIIVSSSCVRKRNRKSTCEYCLEICEHEALSVKGNQLIIDSNNCTLCGECVIVCPLSAIEGLVNNRTFDNGSLVYNTEYVPTIKELLIYKIRGLSSIQTQKPLNKEWETALTKSNNILELLGESPIIVTEKVLGEMLSRRALFSSLQKEGKQLAKNMAPAAWKMEKDDWKLTKYYPDYQFYSVKISEDKCTLCQVCFSLCPENLFHIEGTQLLIDHEKCVDCTSCTDVCPENAIEIVPDIKRKSKNKKNITHKSCKDCGHTFYTFKETIEKCHICINRDSDWLSPY